MSGERNKSLRASNCLLIPCFDFFSTGDFIWACMKFESSCLEFDSVQLAHNCTYTKARVRGTASPDQRSLYYKDVSGS